MGEDDQKGGLSARREDEGVEERRPQGPGLYTAFSSIFLNDSKDGG